MLTLILTIIFVPAANVAQTPEVSADAFVKAMETARSRLQSASGRYRFTSRSWKKNDELDSEYSEEVALLDGMLLSRLNTRIGVRIRCMNDRYGFELNVPEPVGTVPRPATLTGLVRNTRQEDDDPKIRQASEIALFCPAIEYAVQGILLPEAVTDPEFQLKSVVSEDRGNGQFARVTFSYSQAKNGFLIEYPEATVYCGPNNEWRVVEYEYSYRTPMNSGAGEVLGKVSVGSDDPPVISRMSTQEEGSDIKMTQEVLVELLREPVAREEFYLTHYGLEEPTFRAGGVSAMLLYLVAALLCVFVGIMIARYRRRGRNST